MRQGFDSLHRRIRHQPRPMQAAHNGFAVQGREDRIRVLRDAAD